MLLLMKLACISLACVGLAARIEQKLLTSISAASNLTVQLGYRANKHWCVAEEEASEIHCIEDNVIRVISAMYNRRGGKLGCPQPQPPTDKNEENCFKDQKVRFGERCNFERECAIPLSFHAEACPGYLFKGVRVVWECIPGEPNKKEEVAQHYEEHHVKEAPEEKAEEIMKAGPLDEDHQPDAPKESDKDKDEGAASREQESTPDSLDLDAVREAMGLPRPSEEETKDASTPELDAKTKEAMEYAKMRMYLNMPMTSYMMHKRLAEAQSSGLSGMHHHMAAGGLANAYLHQLAQGGPPNLGAAPVKNVKPKKVMVKGSRDVVKAAAAKEVALPGTSFSFVPCYRWSRANMIWHLQVSVFQTSCNWGEACFKIDWPGRDEMHLGDAFGAGYDDPNAPPDPAYMCSAQLVKDTDSWWVTFFGIGLQRNDFNTWGVCMPKGASIAESYFMQRELQQDFVKNRFDSQKVVSCDTSDAATAQ